MLKGRSNLIPVIFLMKRIYTVTCTYALQVNDCNSWKKEKKETEKLLIFNNNKLRTVKYKPQTNITFKAIKSKCLSKV